MKVQVVNIEAATATTADELQERAIAELGVWGGMSSSIKRSDDLTVAISFDPKRAKGGYAGVLDWLEGLGVEFTAEFSAWDPAQEW